MDNIYSSAKVTMINPRGGLREIQSSMVPDLKSQGWKIVVNPKRDYYPELDSSGKNSKTHSVSEIDDDIESRNILIFEDV